MSSEITMPKLSDTMEEGKILRWLKHPGDEIHHGDQIAEVETDKADMVLEAFDDGVLDEVTLKEGESAKVGAVIATLRKAGDASKPRPKLVAGSRESHDLAFLSAVGVVCRARRSSFEERIGDRIARRLGRGTEHSGTVFRRRRRPPQRTRQR